MKSEKIKTFYIHTFGCKTNQSESDTIAASLLSKGLKKAASCKTASPDCIIINTCTVTAAADKKTRQHIRRIRKDCPDSRIIVTGCGAVFNSDFFRQIGADSVIEKSKILNMHKASGNIVYTSHSRPFLKIQDGCEQNCSYCIVPLVRGKYTSSSPDSIIRKLEEFSLLGFEEIVLSGIHIGKYGADFKNEKIKNLAGLLKIILRESSAKRIRLSSIEILEIDDELIQVISGSKGRIAGHLHIPLQSGSNKILGLMNRNYSAEFFLKTVNLVKNKIKDIALTTDIIIGFPHESDEDFSETMDLIKKTGMSKVHIFKYSEREKTKAASMDFKIDEKIKTQRCRQAGILSDDLRKQFINENLNKVLEVICEKYSDKDSIAYGTSENYIKVFFNIENAVFEHKRSRILKVKTFKIYKDGLFGVVV